MLRCHSERSEESRPALCFAVRTTQSETPLPLLRDRNNRSVFDRRLAFNKRIIFDVT
jgi:hypothetical protein